MRTQSIRLAIAIAILCPCVSAQWVQTSELQGKQTVDLPSFGTNLVEGTSAEPLGAPPKHGMRTAMQPGVGTVRLNGSLYPFSNDRFMPGRVQVKSGYVRAKSFPQSGVYVVDTAIVRSTGGMTRYLNLYNAGGKRTSWLVQWFDRDLWVNSGRDTYTYDASNNMISELSEYWSDDKWANASHHTYAYDTRNNMLSHLHELWTNGRWDPSVLHTCTYDARSNMLCELVEWRSNGVWVNYARDEYSYDASNNMLSDMHEMWADGQWAIYYSDRYTYDANGNMLSDLFESWWNGQLLNGARSTYAYDAHGNLVSFLRAE